MTTRKLVFVVKEDEDIDDILERIVGQIRKGYTSWYGMCAPSGNWKRRGGRDDV